MSDISCTCQGDQEADPHNELSGGGDPGCSKSTELLIPMHILLPPLNNEASKTKARTSWHQNQKRISPISFQ